MHRPREIRKTWRTPLFSYRLYVVIAEDLDRCFALLPPVFASEKSKLDRNTTGGFYCVCGSEVVVGFPCGVDKVFQTVVTHESVHAAYTVLEGSGVYELRGEGHETLAYLAGWVSDRIAQARKELIEKQGKHK